MDQRVVTPYGLSGKIIGGPVAEMCIVGTDDGNMAPLGMSSLTIDIVDPPATDVRSITSGGYDCRTQMSGTNDITFVLIMSGGNRYPIANEVEREWSANDDLSIQFIDGPLEDRFSDAQNSRIIFKRVNDGPSYYCKKP